MSVVTETAPLPTANSIGPDLTGFASPILASVDGQLAPPAPKYSAADRQSGPELCWFSTIPAAASPQKRVDDAPEPADWVQPARQHRLIPTPTRDP